MSLRKPIKFLNTLAFRLTLWYAGIFTLSSCVAFLLFYMLITSFMRNQTDQELLGQVNRFATLQAAEGVEAVKGGAWVEAQAARDKKVFFRFLSLDGQVFSSSNMVYWENIPVTEKAIRELLHSGRPVMETLIMKNRPDQVRILYAMISSGIIIQVGLVMESYSRFLAAFKSIFIITMSLLILLAAGLGWFMARRAVSGVEAVTRTARKISRGSLEERVLIKGQGDEIDQLAQTFNQMLDRIQTLVTEIKEMTDHIAHDLRSPLTRIRGHAEVTLTTAKSLSEYEAMAAGTIEDCDRLLDMTNTLLLISKTESGVNTIAMEEINLTLLIQEGCELFRPTAEDKGLSLNCEVSEGCRLKGDTRMIQRLLANLLDNAIKYTPSGGFVTVSLEEQEENLVIEVKDSGIGISPDDLPRIFERFYRSDRSRSLEGIGLGLSLARAIARAHRGDLSALSQPNQGSTFRLILPKSRPAQSL
ncbi:MAG: HAMP domain-containing protein [Deltaproteobacteria bacterium]|nr:HAMP domain-containing protein [Deltaproteobacteria bacterium]